MKTSALLFSLILAGSAGWASAAGNADLVTVVDPYVRLAPPNAKATGAFMVLKNTSDKEIKVTKAESTVSKVTELHTHINEGGVMKMRQVPDIAIAAKGEAVLQPGGLHVMLIDMKAPLKEGDNVSITLGFDDGSSKPIEAPVRKIQVPTAAAGNAHSQH